MNRRILVAACALALTACSSTGVSRIDISSSSVSGSSDSYSSSSSSTDGKYTQTWQQSYDQTTCAEWNKSMAEHQRWVAAADMLVNGRQVWGIDSMPTDSLVDTFEADIDQGCDPIATETIADIATELLMIGGQKEYGG